MVTTMEAVSSNMCPMMSMVSMVPMSTSMMTMVSRMPMMQLDIRFFMIILAKSNIHVMDSTLCVNRDVQTVKVRIRKRSYRRMGHPTMSHRRMLFLVMLMVSLLVMCFNGMVRGSMLRYFDNMAVAVVLTSATFHHGSLFQCLLGFSSRLFYRLRHNIAKLLFFGFLYHGDRKTCLLGFGGELLDGGDELGGSIDDLGLDALLL